MLDQMLFAFVLNSLIVQMDLDSWLFEREKN
jgi:hypothetical protein